MATRQPTTVIPGAGLGYITATPGPVGQLTQVPSSTAQPGAFQVPLAPRAITMSTSTRFIEIYWNGQIITSAVSSMDFTGPGVYVSNTASAVTINIPGSNGTPTGPNNALQYNDAGSLAGSANLSFYSGNSSILSVIGNVNANYFVGDATRLFNIPGANIVGQIPYAANANFANIALTAVSSNTVTNPAQTAITSLGTLSNLSVSGNIAGGNINTVGQVSVTGNITASNIRAIGGLLFTTNGLLTSANVSATGNVSGNNINVANLVNVNGQVSVVGNITGGNIVSFGNVSASYIIGDGSLITNLPPGNYNNTNVASFLASFGSNTLNTTGNLIGGNIRALGFLSAIGDIIGGNVNAGASIVATSHTGATFSATGNITGGNINTGGIVTATGNVTGGNLRTVGQVSATGNITGNYFVGNGSLLTGISGGGYGDSNVVTLLAGFGSNTVSTTGNITGGNIIGNIIGSGAGTPTIASATNLDLSAASAVRVIGGGTFRLPTLTTAQIANLTAVNGDMVYNSTTAKIQAYANNAWGNITLT